MRVEHSHEEDNDNVPAMSPAELAALLPNFFESAKPEIEYSTEYSFFERPVTECA
jgi:hypothetical protein